MLVKLDVSTQLRADSSGRRSIWPVATFALVAANLLAWCAVAWFYQLSPLATQNSKLLLRAGAVNGELLRAGEWWRIVTSQFLHVHFPHFIFNMIALFLLGGMFERGVGSWRLAVLYFGSGIVGQVAGVVATPVLVSSGASQAIMGLAGGDAIRRINRSETRNAGLAVLLIFVAVQVALDVATAGYIKAGHLGGFIAGAILGFVMRPSETSV